MRSFYPIAFSIFFLFFEASVGANPPDPVYLANRTDGQAGSGVSADDPYDVSDASNAGSFSRFDERMREITTYFGQNPPPPGQQHVIHLAPGIYRTWGDDGNFVSRGPGYGFFLSPNTMLSGAGIGKTIIKLIGVKYVPGDPVWGRWSHAALASGDYNGSPNGGILAICNNVAVQDITVDCNTRDFHPPQEDNAEVHDYSIDGVKLNGSNCTISRVEVLHSLGTTGTGTFTESAAISISANGANSTNSIIEYCIVDKPVGDYVNGIILHNDTLDNTHGIYGTVRYCVVKDNPQWNAYSSASGLGGNITEFYGNTATNVGYGFRWDTNNLFDTRLKYNTFIGSDMGTVASPTYRTPRAIELSPGSPINETIGNFQIEGNYFRVPGDGKGFIHMQFATTQSGVPAIFNGLTLKNNTFASDSPANTVCALDIDDGIPDHPEDDTYFEDTLFGDPNTGKEYNTLTLITNSANTNLCQDIHFLGGNTLLGSASSVLWRQQGLAIPQPDIRSPIITTGTAPSVQIAGSGAYASYTVTVGQSISFTVAATFSTGTLTSYNLPRGSTTGPSLPITAPNPSTTFSWTPSIDQIGTHTVSFIADNGVPGFGVVKIEVKPDPAINPITWKNLTNSIATYFPRGSSVEKSIPGVNNTWDSRAISSDRIVGDGSISFRFTRTDKLTSMALNSYDASTFSSTMSPEFALVAHPDGQVHACENPFRLFIDLGLYSDINLGAFTTSNVFTISRQNGVVYYYKDSTLIRTAPASERLPLFAECNFANYQGGVSDCIVKNGTPAEEVTWGSFQGMTSGNGGVPEEGTRIWKTGSGGSWNAEALSTKRIIGDGFVSFKFAQVDKTIIMGLSTDSPNTDPLGVEYAVIARPGASPYVQIVDFWGNSRGYWPFSAGDVFRIARQGETVTYYQNNTALVSSVYKTSLPLMAECDAFDQGATVTNCIYGGASATEPVVWQFPYNVAASNITSALGSTLQKTSGGADWQAEAVSTKRFDGDGYVQFRFGQTNKTVGMSLAARDRDVGSYSCEYLMIAEPYVPEVNGPGVVIVDYGVTTPPGGGAPYNGIYRGVWAFNTTDTFTIARENGIVKFYKNGVFMIASNKYEPLPLMALCQIYDVGGSVTNCNYSGGNIFKPVTWNTATTSDTNLSVVTTASDRGSRVTKIASSGNWGTGIAQTDQTMNGDGAVQFEFGPNYTSGIALLGSGTNARNFVITYSNNGFSIDECDTVTNVVLTHLYGVTSTPANSVFTLIRRSGVIKYYLNGSQLTESAFSGPLGFHCAIPDAGGYVKNINLSGFSP